MIRENEIEIKNMIEEIIEEKTKENIKIILSWITNDIANYWGESRDDFDEDEIEDKTLSECKEPIDFVCYLYNLLEQRLY